MDRDVDLCEGEGRERRVGMIAPRLARNSLARSISAQKCSQYCDQMLAMRVGELREETTI